MNALYFALTSFGILSARRVANSFATSFVKEWTRLMGLKSLNSIAPYKMLGCQCSPVIYLRMATHFFNLDLDQPTGTCSDL
jgi:hypothetical protein